MDSDKNGLLTEEELQNGFQDICCFELFVDHFNGTDEDNFLELFSKLDLDHDGLLDYNEFLQAAINHQAMLNKENIWEMFKMFDIDGDGYITQDELQYVFKQNMNHDPSRQFIEEIMQDVDKNNDN